MERAQNVLARPLEDQELAPEKYVSLNPSAEAWQLPGVRRRFLNLLALEHAQWDNYHHWYCWAPDESLKLLYGEIGAVESRHIAALSSLRPQAGPVDEALWREQALLETFAVLGQEESEIDVRDGFEYLLAEIVEHHYLISHLTAPAGMGQSGFPDVVAARRGRPMEAQHLATFDAIKRPRDRYATDPATWARLQLGIAAVREALRGYLRSLGSGLGVEDRRVLAAIAAVKEKHLALLESFLDPAMPAIERALRSEVGETIWYRRYWEEQAQEASHPGLADLMRNQLADEMGHLTRWEQELGRREKRDVSPLTRSHAAVPPTLLPLAKYLEKVVASQLQRRSKGKSYVEIGKTKEAFS